MKEGRQVWEVQGVREGLKEELLREDREERNGGGAGRGSAWTEGGSEGVREGREGEELRRGGR